jgi:alpha-beta hydrolase superfamily lysophospholipase
VLVDSEPKAARAVAAAEPLLARAPTALGASGRGSNWAHGYRGPGEPGGGAAGCEDDAKLLKRALDAVRREMERCPSAPDILLVHGLGGGACPRYRSVLVC